MGDDVCFVFLDVCRSATLILNAELVYRMHFLKFTTELFCYGVFEECPKCIIPY